MGLFSRFSGKQPEDKVARFMRDQIRDRVNNGDAVALAEACAALAGAPGPMVFGMVISEFPGRAAIRDEALDALRATLPMLPDDQCARLFAVVARAELPAADRNALLNVVVNHVRTRLATCDVAVLVDACAALGRRQPVAHDDIGEARQELVDLGLARLRELVPTLDDDECNEVFAAIRRARLPIDIAARSVELANRRRVAMDHASGSEPRNVELERAIAANPDDPEPSSILADWLHDQGHPRGELIALQLRAESDPSLEPAVEAHIDAHAAVLLGPLAGHRRTHDHMDHAALTWRRGFIDRVLLSCNDDVDTTVAELLVLVLAHPSARMLRALEIGINTSTDTALDDVLDVLVSHRPALREVRLGEFTQDQCEISWYRVGDLAPMWAVLPDLRTLVVHGGDFELGTIEHATLERAEFQTGGLSIASANAIATARWPRLRHLDVWCGDPNYGGEVTMVELRALLARADLLELSHLGLMNSALTDAICEALPTSALAPQLRELDLSMGTMSDDGARTLARSAASFPRLVTLDVDDNYLSDAGIAELRRAFPKVVVVGEQRDSDEDYRYPSVGE